MLEKKGGDGVVKIVTIGDNVVDKYINLKKYFPGGNALNVAVFAHKYGAITSYIGCIGNDQAGKHIYSALKKEGVEVFHIKVVKAPNRYAVVKLVDGERNFLPGGNRETNQMLKLDSEDFNYIKQFHLVHSSAFSFTENLLPKIKNMGIKISFDYSNYFESDYLDKTLPYIDYAFFSTEQKSSKEIKLFQKETSLKGPKLVLVTRGAKGAILFYKGAYMMQPAIDTTAIDTLGAGDAFIASFLVSFMKFESLKNGLEMAAIRASQVCMYYGAFGYGLDYK